MWWARGFFSSLVSNKSQKSSQTRCTGHRSRAPALPSLTALLLNNPWDTGQSLLCLSFPFLKKGFTSFVKQFKTKLKQAILHLLETAALHRTPPAAPGHLTQPTSQTAKFFFIFPLETDNIKSQKATIASPEGAVFTKPSRKGQQPIQKHGKEVNRAGF